MRARQRAEAGSFSPASCAGRMSSLQWVVLVHPSNPCRRVDDLTQAPPASETGAPNVAQEEGQGRSQKGGATPLIRTAASRELPDGVTNQSSWSPIGLGCGDTGRTPTG